jgi:hypothetical protein
MSEYIFFVTIIIVLLLFNALFCFAGYLLGRMHCGQSLDSYYKTKNKSKTNKKDYL